MKFVRILVAATGENGVRRVALLLCVLLALPLLGVLGAWFVPRADSWALLRHQFDTVLPGYAVTSLLLA
ncbi:MAG TPA: iron ABC transporter permease, partial [Methylibium sp.]|nr:iron ABC transporter permease [Methylibium sp.]